MIAAVTVLVLYAGLTLGAQAVSAIGVGVARPPKNVPDTAYVGVRLDHTELTDGVLLDEIQNLGVSVVVDARAATHRSVELEMLADRGVDIANGGWGKGSFLRWNRAHNDVVEGRQADRPGGGPAGARVLPRSPPRCVRPVLLAPPEAEAGAGATTPSARRACRRGSSRARSTCSTVATATPRPWRSRSPTSRRSSSAPACAPRRSGSCAEPRAPAEVRRGSGAGGSGRAGGPAHRAGAGRRIPDRRALHARAGGDGTARSRRAHVRRRAGRGVDPAIPRHARRSRMARDVLHAR